MKLQKLDHLLKNSSTWRPYLCSFCLLASFFCLAFLVSVPSSYNSYKQRLLSGWGTISSPRNETLSELRCEQSGSEPLPRGIIARVSNFELQPLQGSPCSSLKKDHRHKECSQNVTKSLLGMAVGIKQKKDVDLLVQKFISSNFTVMLFHYDGIVEQWRDCKWSDKVIHVSAINQTKWWFAKRFLHPDIVEEYEFIFLWDEDLTVEKFHPERYISIIKREGLEISQPALDPAKSEVHHQITARLRSGDVHRRTYKDKPKGGCYKNSTAPPCTGWVEMMAPVFSRAAWRCVWNMIQNDLIYAWGLDAKLGYCVKGDRTKNIGVVDSEYIIHKGIPSLGGSNEDKTKTDATAHVLNTASTSEGRMVYPEQKKPHGPQLDNGRLDVRRRSYAELSIFRDRWQKAVKEDECWDDPYPGTEMGQSPKHQRGVWPVLSMNQPARAELARFP